MKFEIISHKKAHEKITEKDYTIAFLLVYKEINHIISNRFFKSEINDGLIMQAIVNVLTGFTSHEQQLHFVLSLVHNSELLCGNKRYTLTSITALSNFDLVDMLYLAVKCINSCREDDGFLAYISESTVKKYDSMESIVKEIYNSDKETFKSIIVELGLCQD